MEVHSRAQKHAHPDEGQQAQGHAQRGDGGVQRVAALRLHLAQHGQLLHDHEGAVGQQEGVARDVEAVPEAAFPLALLLALRLLPDPVQRGGLVAAARVVLDGGEQGCADVPDGRAHEQGAEPPQDQAGLARQEVVGEGNEGQEETERPGPGHFDKIHVQDVALVAEVALGQRGELLEDGARHHGSHERPGQVAPHRRPHQHPAQEPRAAFQVLHARPRRPSATVRAPSQGLKFVRCSIEFFPFPNNGTV